MDNFSSKIKEGLKPVYGFFEINSHRHWNFIVYVFFVLVSILILYSFYLLYEIRNDQIFQVSKTPEVKAIPLKEDLLKKTVELYSVKANKRAVVESAGSPYSDPSL